METQIDVVVLVADAGLFRLGPMEELLLGACVGISLCIAILAMRKAARTKNAELQDPGNASAPIRSVRAETGNPYAPPEENRESIRP